MQPEDSNPTSDAGRRRRPIAGFAAGPGGAAVWLDGGQPQTACPNCRGAMRIRLWLSVAECPLCNTRIGLSEAQEQQALALVGQGRPREANELARPLAVPSQLQAEGAAAASGVSVARPALASAAGAPAEQGPAEQGPAWMAASRLFILCWLISAAAHMSLVIALGLWLIEEARRGKPISLAASVSDMRPDESVEQFEPSLDESPIDAADSLMENSTAAAISADDQRLVESVSAIEQPPGELLAKADLGKLPAGVPSPGQVLAGRDPALRGELVAREGGSGESEAAVARALKWLQRHQDRQGGWSLNRFGAAGDCNGRCANPGVESDTAATALALLPFLGAGQTHLRGEYTLNVARGLRALMDMQRSDGDLRGRGSGNMYAHGQATIALCEAYALSQADNLREPAQRAVNFIVAAQHEAGGWRYRPGEPGDLSVVGWQIMALRSAQMAYLEVPPETLLKATRFLNSVQQRPATGLYCYMPGTHSTPVMTAEGLLCRQYSGWRHNNPQLIHGVSWLESKHLPRADQANMYFWYYGTQVMHHMGGKSWDKWNAALRDLLISLQAGGGHEDGSWAPLGGHDSQGGRLYTTALAACTLEVYYRHLPLYRSVAAGDAPAHPPRGKR